MATTGDPPIPDAPTYEMFYGLRDKPFSPSTDPKFLHQGAAYERAGHALLSALDERRGVTVLTGPPGIGKTTLCRSVVPQIDRRTFSSLVLEPPLSIDDLLKTMLVDFGSISREDLARTPEATRDALRSTLTSLLASLASLQAGALVIIDQAQNLPVALLEELGAMLSDPSALGSLQVVLVGDAALTSLLERPALRALNAMVTHHLALGPLGVDEIAGYVTHRLSMAGDHARVEFDQLAIARLGAFSAGVPRVVNSLCDRALAHGRQSSAGVIGGALIELAAADLQLQSPRSAQAGLLAALWLATAFVLLVVVGAAAALWVSRDAVARTVDQWEHVPQPPGGPVRRLPPPLTIPAAPEGDFR